MKWFGFIIFWIMTLLYIWNGKDSFTKREWGIFFIKFITILAACILLVLLSIAILSVYPIISVHTAKTITTILPLSLLSMLGMKFLVVMLCTMFSRILGFHQQHNTAENHAKLSSLSNNFGPALLILAKCLVSAGSILIFYGIWIGTTY
ncbi:hypothetical protein [Brenneria tiliae]|uniref:hypothetical protein n=1 Tax=Brenneria tiliae TaxID=2914984 RepID=UPI00201501DB|nr:hypothetical protein [Brenneria tiliae]MCL2897395.1 hypothetical protein [Brenneria tiliae]MCL2901662.1 hypothetical protein [Brenneria tiliae]